MWLGPSSSFSYLIYLIIITLEREWQSLGALNLSYCFLTFLTWGWHTEENEIVFLHSMTLHAIKIKWESNEEIDQFFLHGTHDLSHESMEWNFQLCGSYLLTHDLSHELRFQLDRKVLGTSCTIPTPNFSIIARSLLPMNIVSSFILH